MLSFTTAGSSGEVWPCKESVQNQSYVFREELKLLYCSHQKPEETVFCVFFFWFIIHYFWLCWVFVAAWALLQLQRERRLSSCGFSLRWLLLLQSKGSQGSQALVAAEQAASSCDSQTGQEARSERLWSTAQQLWAHGFSCSSACGILPGHRWNPCFLHWQADSLPQSHQGSP